ncbi:hypothetical protein GALMADRAFT_144375 [Galerina marginata CBS 339.88]|uniref:Uncharacterized protein n=1 Tax=Galerina marginata (strain CBS 339.88) TaxID=685588 RepID=A0A067ST79_GALM3|nr:hypothetical protein GALMADRAFT_144375 [Galerina marginata CBS 339.88]
MTTITSVDTSSKDPRPAHVSQPPPPSLRQPASWLLPPGSFFPLTTAYASPVNTLRVEPPPPIVSLHPPPPTPCHESRPAHTVAIDHACQWAMTWETAFREDDSTGSIIASTGAASSVWQHLDQEQRCSAGVSLTAAPAVAMPNAD